ncbi:MAG: hypothetical protein K5659_09645 [Lachnospiraceae bacterium]|nr:hypothetical protein [Lachnospiraceae bacterium]
MEEYNPIYELEELEKCYGFESEDDEELSEGEIWDDVMSYFFPNAIEEELEDELDSWFND